MRRELGEVQQGIKVHCRGNSKEKTDIQAAIISPSVALIFIYSGEKPQVSIASNAGWAE